MERKSTRTILKTGAFVVFTLFVSCDTQSTPTATPSSETVDCVDMVNGEFMTSTTELCGELIAKQSDGTIVTDDSNDGSPNSFSTIEEAQQAMQGKTGTICEATAWESSKQSDA